MKTEQWVKHLTKADYLTAARVFLKESRAFSNATKGMNVKQASVKHKEYVRRVTAELRTLGWTFVEYQNYRPTPKESSAFEKLALELFTS